ncbi:MAG: hypothetical protein PHZ19_06555 [Candidatus Thermoplasmatota archaeon]|nr:hypothetical protein [Candidatus Thermoplasmatota archaeon]
MAKKSEPAQCLESTKPKTPENKAVVPLSDKQIASVERYREKRKKAIPLPKFTVEHDKKTGGNKVIMGQDLSKEQGAAMLAALTDITGTTYDALSSTVLAWTAATFPDDDQGMETAIKATCGALAEIAPQDGLEGLLASQMVACHNLSLYLLRKAVKTQYREQLEAYLNQANKLMRTFTAQVEALKKYRSKGEQKVTVEHVHVNEGGQAIVGTVNQGRGGIHKKNGE